MSSLRWPVRWLGIYGCVFFCRQGFTPPASAIAVAPSGLCSAAMSSLRWPVRWLGIYGCVFLSAGVHTACLHVGCRPFVAVFSSHVMPTLAGAVAWDLWLRFFFVGRGSHRLPPQLLSPLRGCVQQPCHPYVGRCGGLGSMAAVCWCCFALFLTNNTIPPTEIWRQTYFTVLHLLLCLFVFVLNN